MSTFPRVSDGIARRRRSVTQLALLCSFAVASCDRLPGRFPRSNGRDYDVAAMVLGAPAATLGCRQSIALV